MIAVLRHHRFLFACLLTFATLLLGVIIFLATRVDAAGEQATGKRLITVYDRGEEKGIFTSAKTLRTAFAEAGIYIDQNDMVEPSLDETLTASNYDVNVYRARPVLIVDGNVRQRVMSSYQTPKQIASSAGINLFDEDEAKLTRVDDLASGAGLQLTITRATPFTLVLYGKKVAARTQASTVGVMLNEKNITLSDQDGTSLPLSAPIKTGLTVEVWRNGVQTVTEERQVDFDVEQIKDADREVGYRKIKTSGEKGTRNVTFEINMQNGKEVSRKEIQSVTTKKPKKQVEIIGTKPVMTPYTGGGSKDEWLTAAGIPREFWGAADAIISQESGWNPNARNPSSGACGLAQANPCSKVPGNPYDPVDSLRWMNGYVTGRYGGWQQALAHKQQAGWY